LKLAVSVNDLGPPLALGLGAAGHGPLHLLGDLDVLDLHDAHIHAPRLGQVLDDVAQVGVQGLTMRQNGVEVDPSEHAAQCRLGDLGGGDGVVLHLHDRLDRVNDVEQHDGVDPGGDVVLGDDLLRGDGQGDHAGVDPLHALQEGNHQMRARLVDGPQTAQAEDDAALILPDELDGQQEHEHQEDDDRDEEDGDGHRVSFAERAEAVRVPGVASRQAEAHVRRAPPRTGPSPAGARSAGVRYA